MNQILNIEKLSEYEAISTKNAFQVLYFTGEKCSVCHAMFPKVKQLIEETFTKAQLMVVNIEKAPELTGHFSVFTVPVVLLVVDGKEYMREVRSFSIGEIEQKIDKIYQLYFS